MGRVVLACKSDEERKMATCPVFAPYPLHTDRQAESVRHCVGFRSGITDVSRGGGCSLTVTSSSFESDRLGKNCEDCKLKDSCTFF